MNHRVATREEQLAKRARELHILSALAPRLFETESEDDIFRLAGAIVHEELGYQSAVFKHIKTAWFLEYVSVSRRMTALAKTIAGLDVDNFRMPLSFSIFTRSLDKDTPLFFDNSRDVTREGLALAMTMMPDTSPAVIKGIEYTVRISEFVFPFINQKIITAPITFFGEPMGNITLFGEDLCQEDIPTIQHFADIIAAAVHKKRIEKALIQSEAHIKKRLEFEQCVTRVSSHFLTHEDFNTAMNKSLSHIGSLCDADRAYVFLAKQDLQFMDTAFEWCAHGAPSQLDNLQNIELRNYPTMLKMFIEHEYILIHDVDTLPEGTDQERAEKKDLQDQNLKSVLLAPIRVRGGFEGFLGLDNLRHTHPWGDDHLWLLSMCAEIMGSVIMRFKIYDALQHSEKRYRGMVDDLDALVCRFNPEGILTFVNEQYCKYFNTSRDELIGRDFFKFVPEKDRDFIRNRYKSLTQDNPVSSYEHPVIKQDGNIRWMEWIDRALFDDTGRLTEFQSIGFDVTKRKLAQEQITALSHKVISSQEEERARLSRELHDEVGQQLSAIQLILHSLLETPEPGHRRIRLITDKLEDLTKELRRICRGLRPAALDALGLDLALSTMVSEFQSNFGLDISLSLESMNRDDFPPDTAIGIYRIVQEALTNMARYSGAGAADIHYHKNGREATLTISDHGRGFEPSGSEREQGMGLAGMKERAALFSGSLHIDTAPGRGARIVLSIPLKETAE